MLCTLASTSWEEWRIWRRRSHVTVRHLLSDLMAIPIDQILSITSLLLCLLALISWDLEEAITCHRQALTLQPHGLPSHSITLNNLATAVSIRFDQLGRMEDLEEVIKYYSEAKFILPTGILANQQLHPISLPSSSFNVITSRNWMKAFAR